MAAQGYARLAADLATGEFKRSQILIDLEFFRISIKHKPLAGDEQNVQQAACTLESLVRDAVDERMPFQ